MKINLNEDKHINVSHLVLKQDDFLLLFSRAKKVTKRALALCIIRLPISASFRKFEKLVVPPQTRGSHFLHFNLFPCGCFNARVFIPVLK